jgi:hypothetical protein
MVYMLMDRHVYIIFHYDACINGRLGRRTRSAYNVKYCCFHVHHVLYFDWQHGWNIMNCMEPKANSSTKVQRNQNSSGEYTYFSNASFRSLNATSALDAHLLLMEILLRGQLTLHFHILTCILAYWHTVQDTTIIQTTIYKSDLRFWRWLTVENIIFCDMLPDRLCVLVARVSGYRSRGLGFDSRPYQM